MSPTAPSPHHRVALVGLGLVGSALAERLLSGESLVRGYDIEEMRRTAFAELGGIVAKDPRDVMADADCLMLSLPNSTVVEAVLTELLPELRRGLLVLDTTTGDPDRTEALARMLAKRGIRYCDATIVGSSEQVRTGECIVLTGGSARDVEDCRPLLATFSKQVFHTGAPGSGARMKLVVNLVLGLNRAALAEGLAFASACGIPPAQALDVLRAGVSYSAVMDTKGKKMVAEDFEPQARLSQHLKDVRIILEAAGKADLALPLSATHRELLERAEELGLGPLDNSAIVRVYRSMKGAPP